MPPEVVLAARDAHARGRRPAELVLAHARRDVDLVEAGLEALAQLAAVQAEAVEPGLARVAKGEPHRRALDLAALPDPQDRDLQDLGALRKAHREAQAAAQDARAVHTVRRAELAQREAAARSGPRERHGGRRPGPAERDVADPAR